MTKLIKIPKKMSYFEFEDEIRKQRKKYKGCYLKSKGNKRFIECSGEIK